MLKPDTQQVLRKEAKDAKAAMGVSDDVGILMSALDAANVEKAFVIGYASPEVMGLPEEINEFTIKYCASHANNLLPFGSPDVNRPPEEVKHSMDRLLQSGIKGIKIHPCHQLVYPNEYRTSGRKSLEIIYSKAQEAKIPVMLHTGTSIFPRSVNRFADPIYVDDVAVDFPDLKILLAHGGRPLWMETAFFLVRRHKNVFLDISGIPPTRLLDYFPRIEAIADKSLFGSDWPGPGVPSIKTNVEAILDLPISEEAKRMILRETAMKVVS
jgi:uncharacterized protein